MKFVPLVKMLERVCVDRQDSDTTYFWCLMYQGEFLIKLVVSALVSAVTEERDSHHYRICCRLVRADGIGEWTQALDDLLTGPASQFLDQLARDEKRELTQRVDATRWQHKAVASLHRCLEELRIDTDPLPTKCSLRRWFSDFVLLRNKTRGHGAPKGSECARLCEQLAHSISVITENLGLFGRPWAYLHRNLSGKYRVTHLAGDNSPFAHLKRTTDINIPDGVYIFLSELRHVALVSSNPESTDFLVPNGGFNGKRYELLSYISGDTQHVDATPFLAPTEELPPSESAGIGQLDVYGHCFSNLPVLPRGYIARPVLESELMEQLNLDRHPIVTLTGPGGIGKTWLALNVLHHVVQSDVKRFKVVVWFSARDIDLLPDGPKEVQPHVLSVGEFAKVYVELIDPAERIESGFKSADFFAAELTKSDLGPIIFVFDNFETVKNPAEAFAWIDTFVRPPNKVLITTRKREFAGDYPVTVTGMTQDECDELIDKVSSTLGVTNHISESYREELYRETDGHPYVI
ncbi:MAG: hypothetical protein IH899_12760, partial [Planctomycetes bacterium]|nr:hypothetical protein [Planctomycetota bacterium]